MRNKLLWFFVFVSSGTGIAHAESPDSLRGGIYFTGQNHLGGVRFHAFQRLAHEWTLEGAIHGRAGRDLYVNGVFENGLDVKLKAENEHLTLQANVPWEIRGLRSAASREAMELVGDNLYNPAWGYQNGEVRNARIRREIMPVIEAGWRQKFGETTLNLTAGGEAGVRKTSGMAWFNARSPLPDDYRNLWQIDQTHYTQIDWDNLILQNKLVEDGSAIYAVADRVERVADINFRAAGETEISERFTATYWFRGGYSDRRHYRQMRDLLGADHLTDHDYFLVDNDTYANQLQNDLRHPDRVIHSGDRFGYDYSMRKYALDFGGKIQYENQKWSGFFSLEVGEHGLWRHGYYEKERYPGALSYGTSRTLHFAPHDVQLSLTHTFSMCHKIRLDLHANSTLPHSDSLFLNPQYNNRPVDNPSPDQSQGGAIAYTYTTPIVELSLSAHLERRVNGIVTRRFFDDASRLFVNAAAAHGVTLRRGTVVSATLKPARRWTCRAAAAFSAHRYSRNPTIRILSDVDNAIIDAGSVSYMKGLRVGNAPEVSASLGVNYFNRGWRVDAEGRYSGLRYAEPALNRRTLRIAHTLAESPEAFRLITAQERLPDTFTLNISVSKSIRIHTHRLVIALHIDNLLGTRNQILAAYESPRTPRHFSGDTSIYRPAPTRYLYAYPRTFYVSATFNL